MADQVKPTGRTRLTLVLFIIMLALWAVSCGHQAYAGFRQSEAERPRLAAASLIKALRQYRERRGNWPARLEELAQAGIWRYQEVTGFGVDGRSLARSNYYYLYAPVSPEVATLWAIPTGPQRAEGATHFVVVGRTTLRHWKGAPLELEEVRRIRSAPRGEELALLGLTEQQSPVATRR